MTVVTAAAAPLWATAEAARTATAFGGSSYRAYRAAMAKVVADQTSLIGRLDTVALSGEPVRVIESVGAGVLRVELLDQPNGDAGYLGFVNAAHVGPDARVRATHVVAESGKLPAGATVEVADGRIRLSSGATVELLSSSLRPLGQASSATGILDIAKGFLGAPYVWGGMEAAGIDCSGLIHTSARIGGRVVPRDAHHQWAATRVEARGDELEPGDILYFGERASLDGIDHVGFYAGAGRMLHAPEEGRPVVIEALSDRARARHVGVGRFPPAA